MRNYGISHIKNPKDAIGAVIMDREGDRAIITCLRSGVGECPLVYGVQYIDGTESDLTTRDFDIYVRLEAGKRYMIMSGEVVTIYESNWKYHYYFKYSEHWGADNTSTESIEENGFAYHYDCGCNILKEVK